MKTSISYSKTFLSLLLASLCHWALGQVPTYQTSKAKFDELTHYKEVSSAKIQRVVMPTFDLNKIRKQDEERFKKGERYERFGVELDVDLGLENAGNWVNLQNGDRIWMLEIESKKAVSINLILDKFYLPKGSELTFYNGDHTMVMGPLTSYHNRKSEVYATDLLQGSRMILEYYEPKSAQGQGKIHISVVVHGFENILQSQGTEFGSLESSSKSQNIDGTVTSSSYGDAASCAINVKCSSGSAYQVESDAVGLIIWGASRWGSGALVNNTARNGRGLFITANHVTAFSHVDEFVYRFQYKSPSCSGGDGPSHFSLSGSSSAISAGGTDIALHLLNENPATASSLAGTSVTYLGWNRSTVNPASITTLSHPRGDVMKIAFGGSATQGTSNGSPVWSYKLTSGIHESTSSGGPTFDQNKKFIGVIKGAAQTLTCTNHKTVQSYSSRLSSAWSFFKPYLDPSNTTETSIPNLVRLCPPLPGGITGKDLCQGSSTTYTTPVIASALTYTWELGGISRTTSSNTVSYSGSYYSPGTYSIKVRVNNSCGSGPWSTSKTVIVRSTSDPACGGCGGRACGVMVYPNPATSQVTVELSQNAVKASINEFTSFSQSTVAPTDIAEESNSTTKVGELDRFKVQILDQQQRVVLEVTNYGRKITLNTDEIPSGSYFLRSWFNGKAIETKHLVIKK